MCVAENWSAALLHSSNKMQKRVKGFRATIGFSSIENKEKGPLCEMKKLHRAASLLRELKKKLAKDLE